MQLVHLVSRHTFPTKVKECATRFNGRNAPSGLDFATMLRASSTAEGEARTAYTSTVLYVEGKVSKLGAMPSTAPPSLAMLT
jgi:hypothetical protein